MSKVLASRRLMSGIGGILLLPGFISGTVLIPEEVGLMRTLAGEVVHEELLEDGNFQYGVTSWQSQGAIPGLTGQAVLWDASYPAGLWQPVYVGGATSLSLHFSMRMDLLSADYGIGTFPDFFVATLEFAEDPLQFGLFGGGVQSISLVSADALSGPRGIAPEALFQADPLRPGWQELSLTTNVVAAYATPFFRLFDENSVNGDSRLVITDVSLQVELIPELETGSLVLGALALVWILTRRRYRDS